MTGLFAIEGGPETMPGAPWTRLFGRRAIEPATEAVPALERPTLTRAKRELVGGPPRLAPSLSAPRFPRRIETARLCLDMPSPEDFPALRVMAADPSMFRYSERGGMTQEEAWTLLLRHIGHWLIAGFGVFSVREKESGRFVGQVGGSAFQRGLGPEFDHFPEMTWSIATSHRGRGYATEAAEAVVAALEAQPAFGSSVCLIHVDNQPSLRVAAKLGFRFFRHCHYRDYPAGLFCR